MSLLVYLDRLKAQKDAILAEVESWSLESISRRPLSQEWSAMEVIDHLVRTEVGIQAAARKGLQTPHRIGVRDKLRTRFVHAIFRSDRKVKVPASVTQVLPGSNLSLPEIIQRWDDSRIELADFLNTAPAAELKKGIFRHPVAGWMGMAEILDFFSVHIIHHNYQLARLRQTPN